MADRRLLVVHAHPDDESSKGAATTARYVDEGADVVLVTCTGGEEGEVLNKALTDIDLTQLATIRRAELEAAVAAIGFTRVHHLDERDSGWHEDLENVPAGDCFWNAPLDRPAGKLAAIIRAEMPQVIVTYPPDGGYPHPDHIRTHEVTMRAVDLAADPEAYVVGEPWIVPRVVGTTVFTGGHLKAMHEAMLAAGHPSPYEEWLKGERPKRDADHMQVAAKVHVADWFERRDAALLAHATQVDPEGQWFAVPRDIEAATWPWESFVAIRPTSIPGAPLDDLFAGL